MFTRLNIFLSLLFILCGTCIGKANSDDLAKLNDMLNEMSKEYSDCAALFLNFTMAEELQNGDSAKHKELQQKAYDTLSVATKFGEMAGQDSKAIEGNIVKISEQFNKEIRQGNNKNRFLDLGLKCLKMAEKPDDYLEKMKFAYGLQKYFK